MDNSNYESLVDKLKKIKELADRGAENERDVALRMLNDMLKKHNMSISDLNESNEIMREFRYSDDDEKKIIKQVIYSFSHKQEIFQKANSRVKVIFSKFNNIKYAEAVLKIDFFINAFREEKKLFIRGFINKNDIFPTDSDGKSQSINELSDKEIEELYRVLDYMSTIKKHDYVSDKKCLN